jgi:hypothetical protein
MNVQFSCGDVKHSIRYYADDGEIVELEDVEDMDAVMEELRVNAKTKKFERKAEREKMVDVVSENFDISQLGVKLSHLKVWYEAMLYLNFHKLTTKEICELIKKLTLECGSSYCEMLKNRKLPYVGLANVFVSHGWDYIFVDTLKALLGKFKGKEDETIVWFDIFSHNQCSTTNREVTWWQFNFKEAINKIHHTVIVFTSMIDLYPLSRAWCLWELYCSIVTDSKLEIAVTKEAELQFIEHCYREHYNSDRELTFRVNSEKASSFNKDDQKKIHHAIKYSEGGYIRLNELITAKLREFPAFLATGFYKTGNFKEDLKEEILYRKQSLKNFEMLSKMTFRKVGPAQNGKIHGQQFVGSNENDGEPLNVSWGSYARSILLLQELAEKKQFL